jgi:hypothetical protein
MSEPVVEERVQPHEAPTQQPQDVATAGVTGDTTNAPPKEADAPTTTTGDATNLTPKLSPAELKKQAKAEKQAR